MSVHDALERAVPPGWLSPRRWDSSFFCAGFADFDLLVGEAREFITRDRDLASLADTRVISGHFCLENLLRVTSPASIATVLREPRARLLSLYTYWRITPGLREWFHPYVIMWEQARGPLTSFLSEPQIAQATDNQVCRMLLHGDDRIPLTGFIADDDVAAVAADAIARLQSLGFVGIIELGGIWEGLSELFGFSLQATHANVTTDTGTLLEALPAETAITTTTLRALEARTRADWIVYQHAASSRTGSSLTEIKRLGDAAFATQLTRFGDSVGSSAALAGERERQLSGDASIGYGGDPRQAG